MNRLCTLEQPDEDSGSDSLSTLSSDSDTSESSLSDDIRPRNPFSNQSAGKANGTRTPRGATSAGTATAGAQQTKKADAKGPPRQSSGAGAAGTSGTQRTASKEGKSHTPASIPSTITNVGSATQKPKRIHQTNKQRPGLAKARKVQALEKDETGNIKFPVTVGIITIWSIGHVVFDREAFHNDRYIWPVGYKMSRLYNSMIDPSNLTTYTCSVIDDGEAPKVQLAPFMSRYALIFSSLQLTNPRPWYFWSSSFRLMPKTSLGNQLLLEAPLEHGPMWSRPRTRFENASTPTLPQDLITLAFPTQPLPR